MKVTLVAQTLINIGTMHETPFKESMQDFGTVFSGDLVAEFAGRACYQSWSRPNPATATNQGYMQNILAQEHESVLEHASATFYITGVSRNLTHELVRHRHLSFSELSQRFVDMEDMEQVKPPLYEEYGYDLGWAWGNGSDTWRENYRDAVMCFVERGRKQAREAARAELPSSMETRIVVTGNHRAWREVLKKRGSLHADAEIRLLALELFQQLNEIAPNTYQDFKVKTAKDGREWLKVKKPKPPVSPSTEVPTVKEAVIHTESTKDTTGAAGCSCGTTRPVTEEAPRGALR